MNELRLTARVLPFAPVALRDGVATRVRRSGIVERIDLDPSTLLLATYPELPNSVLLLIQDADTGEMRRATLSQLKIAASGAVATVNGKPGPEVVLTPEDIGAVKTVNGKSGTNITLDGEDVGAVVSVNGKVGPDVELDAGDLGAVLTVNGKAGPDVVLTAEDFDLEGGTGGGVYAGTVDITKAPYGADPTGVEDATQAFNDAFADPDVQAVFGIGSFLISGPISMPAEKALLGVRRRSRFLIPQTFTGQAVCVFQPIENGPMIQGFDFEFEQPDVPYSGLHQYPPAIYARDCPRFVLDKVRISRAWVGIDMKGNSGGATLTDVEGSSFSKFVLIDGSLDTVKVSRMHFWPFGCLNSQNHFTSYLRNGNIGLEAGRCDDLKISDSIFFACLKGVYLRGAEVTQPAVYGAFGTITNTNFDASGGLYAELADMTVSGCMFTTGAGAVTGAPSAGTGGPAIYVGAGAQIELSGCKMFTTVVSGSLGAIQVYGDLVISGMKFENDVDQPLVNVLANASANLTMTGCHIKNRVNRVYGGFVRFNLNPGSFVGNTVTGIGTGVLVSAISGAAVVIDANRCNGLDLIANTKQIGYGNKDVANFKARRRNGQIVIPAGQATASTATNLFPTNDSGVVPASVKLTPFNSDLANGQSAPRSYWVSDMSGNQFTVRINVSAGVALTFLWEAEADVT